MFRLSQLFIIIGYVIFFISRFRKDKKNILVTDNISRVLFIIGYSLLHSINSVEHTIYGIIRNIVGWKFVKKSRSVKIIGFIIMTILLCIMYGITFHGFSTIMFIISGLINSFAVIFLKGQGIRMGTTLAAICNIIAFIIVESYASILGEALCGIIGLMSFRKNYHYEKTYKNLKCKIDKLISDKVVQSLIRFDECKTEN